MHNRTRIVVASLSLSAAAMVGLWQQEGWTDTAVIPVPGDVPTVGPGLTKREDGSPVQMGDRIKPIDGARRSLAHIQKDETRLKSCLSAPLHQVEYDLLIDFSYQYGVAGACKSSIVAETNAGNYKQACEAYLKYRFVAGRDCSLPGSGCRGVWLRSQNRHNKCMEVQ